MNIREFIRKSQFPILLALGTYPMVAVLLMFIAPELLHYGWLFPGAYAALSIVMLVLPGKPRILLCVCGALLLTLPCGLLLQGKGRDVTLLIGVLYAALLFWSLYLPGWESQTELSAGWLCSCFAIGLIGCFFAWFDPHFKPAAWGIRFSFLGFVLLAMLSMNRGSLNLAVGDTRSFTAPMRRKNLLLTVGMFGIALALAAIPWLYDLLETGFGWIVRLITILQNMLTQPEETTEQTLMETTMIPTSAENWRDVLLEGMQTQRASEQTLAIMTAVVLVVVIPALSFALYRLGKWLVKKLHRLIVLVEQAANTQQADFVDEITDTREDTRRERVRDKKRRNPMPWLRNMTPAERIRYRYRRLLTKHPEWKDHETARENLPEEAAQLYERARYSDHPITVGDADRFQNETK